MAEQKKKSHKFHTTRISHHKDGSHTIHHQHEDGEAHDAKHAVSDHDGMMDSMMEHTSPGASESTQDLEQGNHGIPAEHATPAGIPPGAIPTGA